MVNWDVTYIAAVFRAAESYFLDLAENADLLDILKVWVFDWKLFIKGVAKVSLILIEIFSSHIRSEFVALVFLWSFFLLLLWLRGIRVNASNLHLVKPLPKSFVQSFVHFAFKY